MLYQLRKEERLHPLRKFDAQNIHGLCEDTRNQFDKLEAEGKDSLVFLTQNRSVVVVLVELLGKYA